jgi:hypothetical protein
MSHPMGLEPENINPDLPEDDLDEEDAEGEVNFLTDPHQTYDQ